jgi:phenylalanyl-tRNA synthetase beta chain
MNILIPDSWLREYLTTNAKPKELASALSLCGPTVDRIHKVGSDYVYDIEVTTNRVDAMSVYGIAREANAILPRFGYKTSLKKIGLSKVSNKSPLGIEIKNDPKLCKRILAVKLENVKLGPSPKWLAEKLISVGQRPLINAIDITNYVMWEMGHPIHAFDYDRIKSKKIIVREAKKGEKLVTLDNKEHTLSGGEVVFDDGTGNIIDLPGIMGTKNTVVTKDTKNILLWIENVDHNRIRKASIGLNIRSQAAVLNEKQVDTELGLTAILRSIDIFKKVAGAQVASRLIDTYPKKPKPKMVRVTKEFIDHRMGVNITNNDMKDYLSALEIKSAWSGNILQVTVPTFRAHDMQIPEDVVEEIARIYGYHNFPDNLPDTRLPEHDTDSLFMFENMLRDMLKNVRGTEVYTTSSVPGKFVSKNAVKIKNPLGADSEYLRTTLQHSLASAAGSNKIADPFFLFEIGNVYKSTKNDLPDEVMMIAGIFSNYSYRKAKGIVSHLLKSLSIGHNFASEEKKNFTAGRRLAIYQNKAYMGQFGIMENGLMYFDFETEILNQLKKQKKYKPQPKYPPQIEDVTFKLPPRTQVGDLIQSIKLTHKYISKVILKEIYKSRFTFTVYYQSTKKTLTDAEVDKLRNKLTTKAEKEFGAVVK